MGEIWGRYGGDIGRYRGDMVEIARSASASRRCPYPDPYPYPYPYP